MRSYWGTLAGLSIGALGGVAGALFGALIGLLVDLVAVELRAHRATIRFLDAEGVPAWLPRPVPLAGQLLGYLRTGQGIPDDREVDAVADRMRSVYPDRFSRRLVERMILAAADHAWPGAQRFAELVRSETEIEERELVASAVWDALRLTGSAGRARCRMHEIAKAVGLDEGFISRELVVTSLLDAEACAVLGVPRDATQTEVRSAYRRLAAQFHPDTAGSLSEEQVHATEQAFKRIQAAYETLRDQDEQ